MNCKDLDAERLRLLSICSEATSDVLRSDDVDISTKVEAAAEFVDVCREMLEKREARQVGGERLAL